MIFADFIRSEIDFLISSFFVAGESDVPTAKNKVIRCIVKSMLTTRAFALEVILTKESSPFRHGSCYERSHPQS